MQGSPSADATAGDPVRAAVEQLLLAHRDVAFASLRSEEGADGRSHAIAYVVPKTDTPGGSVGEPDERTRVSQWRMAFDLAYRSKAGGGGPSFAGWKSSFTGKPLPQIEMQEWLGATVERILSFDPKKVLEIGCGVGLLVEALAPRCESYVGTDLSPIAVARLAEFTSSRADLSHVRLLQGEAAHLGDQPSGSVDTVLLNSVIQYFPEIGYLRRVVREAARVVRPGGRIFIGDVRHFGLLPMFHAAVQLARAPSDASVGRLKRQIALAVEQDRELAVDPRAFLPYPGGDSPISEVEVWLKRGRFHNEMTCFRYDVVLHVGGRDTRSSPPEAEWHGGGRSANEIMLEFDGRQLPSAIVRGVANLRLGRDRDGLRRILSADDRRPVGQVRAELEADAAVGTEPEDFWALADAGRCAVRIGWSPGSDAGDYDVALTAPGGNRPALSPPIIGPSAAAPTRLATEPLRAAYKQRLGSELHQLLRDHLPDHALPIAVIAVDALPVG